MFVMSPDVEEAFLKRLGRIEEEMGIIRNLLERTGRDLETLKKNSVAIIRCVNEEEADE